MYLSVPEYIIEIAREMNITRAAENLYISQSALNQQLLNLEKELGTPLFIRDRKGWSLTEAGEIYLAYAKEVQAMKTDAYNRIADLAQKKQQTLQIGLVAGYSGKMFASVFTEFHLNNPEVNVMVAEEPYEKLKKDAIDGKVDLAIFSEYSAMDERLGGVCLATDQIYFCAPQECRFCRELKDANEITLEQLAEFQELPFIIPAKGADSYEMTLDIFKRLQAIRQAERPTMEISGNSLRNALLRSGMGALVAAYGSMDSEDIMQENGLRWYPIQGVPRMGLYAVYAKNRYLKDSARAFLNDTCSYFSKWAD